MKTSDWNSLVLLIAGTTLGCILGVVLGLVTAIALSNDRWFIGTDGRLQWETLLAGTLAFVAAVLTVRTTRAQLRQAQEAAAKVAARKAMAARAVLPLALSQINQYVTDCIGEMQKCLAHYNASVKLGIHKIQMDVGRPILPDKIVSALQYAIEYSGDSAAVALSELIIGLQIQNSRYIDVAMVLSGSKRDKMVLKMNMHRCLWDAAEISARVDALYPFARGGEIKKDEIGPDDIKGKLLLKLNASDAEIDEIAANCEHAPSFPPLGGW